MKWITFLILLAVTASPAGAQQKLQKKKFDVPPAVIYGSGKVEKSFIPPPHGFAPGLKSAGEKKADIVVNYIAFPENVKETFEYAVGIWETIIESTVPIYMEAVWTSLGENTLGSCAPYDEFFTNFKNIPRENIYYPVALAEKLSKQQITGPDTADINASFNKNAKWYFGTDGKTPDSLYDFVTVVLHEIGHGLGFYGFYFVSGTEGIYGFYNYGDLSSFDDLVVNANGVRLADTTVYKNPSLQLKNALTSNALYINSPAAITDNGGVIPKLYAPLPWDGGSSVYHLSETNFYTGDVNSLMTPFLGKAEVIHDPGPIAGGILADIGWKHLYIEFEKLKDVEEIQPLVFNVTLESDYDLDTAALFVIYSTDGFISHSDSVPLLPGTLPGRFSAELIPTSETSAIHYFIQAKDVKNRIFNNPAKAPDSLYSIKIGPDNEPPVIVHSEIPFYLMNNENLFISAEVDDNLGVDTVTVEYAINGVAQTPFGLSRDSLNIYSGQFNFNKKLLNDGDIITYQVVAKDASRAQNIQRSPAGSEYSFKTEKIFDMVAAYFNDFNASSADFVIKDFVINTASRFKDGALHSPHPYPSPEQDNKTIDLITILKYPVILKENGTMSFDEIVLVEPGEDNTVFGDEDFYDYVIIEGSKDSGRTWIPVIDGYDSRANTNWKNLYTQSTIGQVSMARGGPEMFVNREINLTGKPGFTAGDTVLFRFRLFSDPYAYGWGWAIDNLRIQTPVSAPLTSRSPGNISVYPNPFENKITVSFQPQKNIKKIQIEVYNPFGQIIKSIDFSDINEPVKEDLSLPELVSGVYFVMVKENGTPVFSQKLIKK
jgi:hypothetical protein